MRKLFLMGAVALLTGCSTAPRIIADVTEVLPSQPIEKVMIYEKDQSMPDNARAIGKVKVTDGGMTPTYKCMYGGMLTLAVKKTAESGGNALHIDEHKTPNLASTCHRIWGTMYVVPDSMVSGNALEVIQQMEEEKDKELLAMTHEQIKRREQMFNNPSNILKMSIGPSWITSEIQTPTRAYKNKMGFCVDIDYQHLWKSGLGVGINYLYHSTSFDEGYSIKMHYIGPSIVASMKFGDNWRMDASLGLGYSVCKEDNGYFIEDHSESNLGVLAQLGIEYMLSKSIGIGIQFNGFNMRMKRPDDINTSKYDFYGIKRLDATLGLRFYL
ncbi:MAG: porin family protein [Prevotella sp.]|nr:porin family protein [Prevotella sp.]